MQLEVRRARGAPDRERAYALRREVFVVEQRVPEELERDEHDERDADHVLALDERGRCVAAGRLVPLDARTGKVGRMAVAAPLRGKGAGAAILRELERIAAERGLTEIVLHAQLTAKGFYDRAGYAAEGEAFEEAGIAHVAMRKRLGPRPTPRS
ncbi:MAG TPA: GNAT family N-acetyltransferase [Anaeromyxobacteraceae bacterium]